MGISTGSTPIPLNAAFVELPQLNAGMSRWALWLLACVPVHGLFWLLCLAEPRFFDLALLWGNRLTWRVHTFFPILAATWEARQRVRVAEQPAVAQLVVHRVQPPDPRGVMARDLDHAVDHIIAARDRGIALGDRMII